MQSITTQSQLTGRMQNHPFTDKALHTKMLYVLVLEATESLRRKPKQTATNCQKIAIHLVGCTQTPVPVYTGD